MRLFVTACLSACVLAVSAAGLTAAPEESSEGAQAHPGGAVERLERPAAESPAQTASQGALDAPVRRSEYVVGPNDVFSLNLWGEVNVRTRLTVTPE